MIRRPHLGEPAIQPLRPLREKSSQMEKTLTEGFSLCQAVMLLLAACMLVSHLAIEEAKEALRHQQHCLIALSLADNGPIRGMGRRGESKACGMGLAACGWLCDDSNADGGRTSKKQT
ncbi:hypothetical protein GQ53DRAFT_545264 [Thozetella sp. PMI_491]|nr:hypothetical protein GQ53DRAFT_545264 [Thozetella sp. PMI_491]